MRSINTSPHIIKNKTGIAPLEVAVYLINSEVSGEHVTHFCQMRA